MTPGESKFPSTPGSMRLPAELIDHIFSFLQGDISTLKACSETHPLFSHLAEQHIFAEFVVEIHDKYDFGLYKQLFKNPHILEYPRTLDICAHVSLTPFLRREVMPIFSIIPRMTNLTSLKICDSPYSSSLLYGKDSLSTFQNCLQQSSIEQLHLSRFVYFPLSILDNGKSIKKLTLSDCIAIREPMSKSPLQLLETLIIRGFHNEVLLSWATSWSSNLKSLQSSRWWLTKAEGDWTGFVRLLEACSSSLTKLNLPVVGHSM